MIDRADDELLAKAGEVSAAELIETTPPSPYRVVRIIDRVAEFLAAATLAAITLILFWNATSRYLLDAPLGWAEEIVTGLLLWLITFGLFIAARRRELILIRVVVRRMSIRAQVRLKMVTDLLAAVVLMHLSWVGLQYLMKFGSDTSAYLRLPKGFFTAALPVGVAAVALALVFQLRSTREAVERAVADEGTGAGGTS